VNAATDPATSDTMSDAVPVEEVWRELVTVALLGTDRRDPPPLPAGVVADVVADAVRPDPASRMLAGVAAVAAARRAAFVPLPAAPTLQPPEPDERPMCPPAAAHTWATIVEEWPVLEDEWMLTVIDRGYRLAPDVLVDAFLRHRNDAVRRSRAAVAAGPLGRWVVDHVPGLAAATAATASAEAVTTLPNLAMPPDLAELLTLDAHTFVGRLLPGFERHEFGPSHRAVLVNLLARCRREVLADTADALSAVGSGLAIACADLCRLRDRMLSELGR